MNLSKIFKGKIQDSISVGESIQDAQQLCLFFNIIIFMKLSSFMLSIKCPISQQPQAVEGGGDTCQ
jgi:hypothetical protein